MTLLTPKEKRREYHLQRNFGIGLSEYRSLYEKQNGLCGICHRPASDFKRSLAVDHCHKTLRIRGLLCPFCNRGLRYYQDDPESMERAGIYLRQGTEWYAPPKKRKRKASKKINKSRKKTSRKRRKTR